MRCSAFSLQLSLILALTGSAACAQNSRAVDRGLAFLAKAQSPDGSFSTGNDVDERVRLTSISALAFLSAGHAPDLGKYGSAVRAATDNLMRAAASQKISPPVRQMTLFVLHQVATVDDNAGDQQRIQQMEPHSQHGTEVIPFANSRGHAWKTLRILISEEHSQEGASPLSYPTLYHIAVLAADLHLDNLSQRIDALLTSRQHADGSWEGNPQSTAFAVLSLTATDHVMAVED